MKSYLLCYVLVVSMFHCSIFDSLYTFLSYSSYLAYDSFRVFKITVSVSFLYFLLIFHFVLSLLRLSMCVNMCLKFSFFLIYILFVYFIFLYFLLSIAFPLSTVGNKTFFDIDQNSYVDQTSTKSQIAWSNEFIEFAAISRYNWAVWLVFLSNQNRLFDFLENFSWIQT